MQKWFRVRSKRSRVYWIYNLWILYQALAEFTPKLACTNWLEQKIDNYSRHFLLMAAFANDDTFKEKNCVSLPEKRTADPSSPLTTLVRLLFSRHCSESSSWENLSCLHFACGAALHAGKPFWLPHRVGLNDWRRIWAEFCFDLSRWKFPATWLQSKWTLISRSL